MAEIDIIKTLINKIDILTKEVAELKELGGAKKQVYTNQEIMDLFGVCSPTLKKWRDSGALGYSQIGSTFLYSANDIALFLKANHEDSFY